MMTQMTLKEDLDKESLLYMVNPISRYQAESLFYSGSPFFLAAETADSA
jgi:hypothetical protein